MSNGTLQRRFIFGLGTGRCGTKSLTSLFNLQDNSFFCHEMIEVGNYALPWNSNYRLVGKYLTILEEGSNKLFTGDVGSYILPHVDKILAFKPDAKFVVIERNKKEVIESFYLKSKNYNLWMEHDGKKWDLSGWDAMHPNMIDAENKKDAISRYYDYYKQRVSELEPKKTFFIKTEDLNDEQKCLDMLQFCGFDNPIYVKQHRNRTNKEN